MFSFEREIKQKQADALALENMEHRRKAFAVALRDVVNTAQGKAVLKYLLSLIPINEDIFSSDAMLMAHSEGRRSAGIELRNAIREADSNYLNLIERQEI